MQASESNSPAGVGTARRAGIWIKLLLAVTSLSVGLLLAEVGCRWLVYQRNQETLHAAMSRLSEPSDSPNAGMQNIIRLSTNERIMYELQPGLRNRTFRNSKVSTDDRGFRIAGTPGNPAPDSITILGIGDSVMFGHGIEGDETYLALLQEQLDQQYPDQSWRVINAAVPGYNTVMEVETLRAKCLSLEPDIVILHVVGNDYAPPRFVRRQEDILDVKRSFLWELCQERVSDRGDVHPYTGFQLGEGWLREKQDGATSLPTSIRALFGPEAFRNAVEELIALSEQHGFDLIVFTNNELGREPAMVREAVTRGVEHVSLSADLRAWLRANGGHTMDGESYHASELIVGQHNRHPSALQHRLAARRLARWLDESGWISRHLDPPEKHADSMGGAGSGR